MMQKTVKSFICICLVLLTVFALRVPDAAVLAASAEQDNQTLAVDPTGKGDGYSAVLYDNTNGLPTSEANAIAETSEGFIWIGSYSGLIRYDGSSFVRIDSTTGIASVVSLYVDSKDRLWIGTNDSGVAVMERGEYQMFSKADGLKSASIRAVVEDTKGVIYVATTDGISYIDESMQLHSLDDPRIVDAYIRSLRAGPDGLIYGITQDGDIFAIQDGAVSFFLSGVDCRIEGVISIFPDPANPDVFYAGTESSEIYYGSLKDNFSEMSVIDVSPLSYIETFERFDDQIWICAGNGIGMIEDNKFEHVDNVPMDSSVSKIMRDYEGNLWFTSTRQGVMKIVPNQFTDLFERYGLSASVVNSTCQYGNQMFFATDSGLMVIENGAVVTSIPLQKAVTASGASLEATDLIEMLDGCRIRSIIRDSKGQLWISTWRKYGLLRYDQGVVTSFGVEDGLFSDRVRTVCERKDGTIMVANTGGVSLIDGDRVTAGYGSDHDIVNTEILTVSEGTNGDLLLGSDGGGIYIINDAGTRNIGTEDGLSSEVVMRIKPDVNRDLYWIVTSNSIAFMTGDYQVTTVQKFPYSNNFDLYENSRGDMWILSSNGIYVTTAEELLANGEIEPIYYGMDNGLPHIATANSYSELTETGDLYIASSTGVTKVNIETPFENVNNLKMAVPFVEADGRFIYPDATGSFVIASNVRKLTIHSFVYNYSLMNPQVTYHLDGFDDSQTTVRRTELAPLDYTNLKGGTYHFVMQLADAQGNGNKELSVEIVKEKALHELLWFQALCVLGILLLIAGIVLLYIREKTKAFLKKEREQKQLIREIVEAFAKVIDMKDAYTNGHSTRVAEYTVMLARELGYDEETLEKYYNIALMHDIGKVGVTPEVLNKPGKLTDEEFPIIKSHTSLGYDTLKGISIMPELAIGAGAHHERPDGKGYPNGLKGDEIPRVAQIIAVADTFDAMYSNRPYRKRMNFEKAVSIIKGASGTQLTADVVDAFLRLVDKGEFRAPDDVGGGTTEDIDNIHKKFDEEAREPQTAKV